MKHLVTSLPIFPSLLLHFQQAQLLVHALIAEIWHPLIIDMTTGHPIIQVQSVMVGGFTHIPMRTGEDGNSLICYPRNIGYMTNQEHLLFYM